MSYQIQLVDEAIIRPGLPKLDYLDGAAGGRPRHSIQVETGYYSDGAGVRLQGEWKSGTHAGSGTQRLDFSPYANFDLKLFANLALRFPKTVAKHPFLTGSSIRLEVDNILNSKPKVRDVGGLTPFTYQPYLLEPIGRTVGITFRKLFMPRPPFRRLPPRLAPAAS